MTVTWTKCSERMPPRSTSRVLYRNLHTKDVFIAEAIQSHVFMCARDFEWATYTPEAWVELNKNNS